MATSDSTAAPKSESSRRSLRTTCCVAGGGPAGMMLALLLARAGVDVVVLEKHGDFLRDFRGDTVHPSTLELMYELGLLEDFLKLPHQELQRLQVVIGDRTFAGPDFSHLPTHCRFVALMPQWDFLDFLAARAKRYATFRLEMNAEVVELVDGDGPPARIRGVRARTPAGELEVLADLVVGCDGRHSTVRRCAGLAVRDFGVPIDVLWFHVAKRADEPSAVLGRVRAGKILITLDRGDYFQCGLLRAHAVTDEDLAAVQRRRAMPVRRIQAAQVFIHRRMFGPRGEPFPISWPLRALVTVLRPLLGRVAARAVGIGFRAEHVRTPALAPE